MTQPGPPPAEPSARPVTPGARRAPKKSWLRRDHPTVSALAGFFTGMVFVVAVPALYAVVLAALVDQERAEDLFPYVLLGLLVPLGLLVAPATRRFGRYMLIGVVTTLVVVVGVGGTMLYLLIF